MPLRVVSVMELGGGWHVHWTKAANSLLQICERPQGRDEVIRRLMKGSRTRQRTLSTLFAMADCETILRSGDPLPKSALPAQLLISVFPHPKMQHALSRYFKNPSVTDGAAGVRFALQTFPDSFTGSSLDISISIFQYVAWLLLVARERTMVPPIRLLELMLRQPALSLHIPTDLAHPIRQILCGPSFSEKFFDRQMVP